MNRKWIIATLALAMFFMAWPQMVSVQAEEIITITFVTGEGTYNGSSGTVPFHVEKGKSVRQSHTELYAEPQAVDSNYGFLGFSLTPDGDVDLAADDILDYTPTEDMTLYCRYAKKIVIRLEASPGNVIIYPHEYPIHSFFAVAGRPFYQHLKVEINDDSLAFAGWSTVKNGEPEIPADGLDLAKADQNTTYYAVYRPAVEVILINSLSGEIIDGTDQASYNMSLKVPKGYPCRKYIRVSYADQDLVLAGWSTDPDAMDPYLNPYDLYDYIFEKNTALHAIAKPFQKASSLRMSDWISIAAGDLRELTASANPEGASLPMDGYYRIASPFTARTVIYNHKTFLEGMKPGNTVLSAFYYQHDGSMLEKQIPVTVFEGEPGNARLFGFITSYGKSYWYEDWSRQAVPGDPKNIWDTTFGLERGREIYDPKTNAWYWLDCIYTGAKATDKEVWMPYIFQEDLLTGKNPDGKWVRYNHDGAMIKGWYTVQGSDISLYPAQAGNTYYYDLITGEMVKGYREIDGRTYHFDELTGILK